MDEREPADRTRRGAAAERVAERFLRASGLEILARNVRYRRGELDLVARDGETIVFVEVRSRRRGSRLDPAATVGPPKQRRLSYAAARWLCENACADRPCRFDLVAVRVGSDGYRIRHVRGAFVAEGP